MANFQNIKQAVAKQFNKISGNLLTTTVSKDDLWKTYLASFPAGSNSMFRTRTEHDCSCCKQFIRAVGNVISIENGQIISIWDGLVDDPDYKVVASAMSKLVKSHPIDNFFLHTERVAGTEKTFEQLQDKTIRTWDHFFVNIPQIYVRSKDSIGPQLSESRAMHDVLARSLKELTIDSIDTVMELILQNSLYRGEEHKFAINEFRQLKLKYLLVVPKEEQDSFVWSAIKTVPASVSKIRNTSIGTLLTELSDGMELEDAVKRFEAMVAPTNYKRPTAIITKAMVEKAKAAIAELGLTSALERRYAKIADLTINNILYANRSVKSAIQGDVFDDITSKIADAPKLDKVEEVSIDKFINDIVPHAETIEVFVDNKHSNHLTSLIAPVDPTAGKLFNWDNNFSWSYNGDVADSIKERVKKAGGNVTGDVCCRLSWNNYDDLDFHMKEPGHYEIFYGNRHTTSPSGGRLDVDMNAGSGQTREPVENIFYTTMKKMKKGTYHLNVHNFCLRETVDVGFEVEIDILGTVHRFSYPKMVKHGETITVATLEYDAYNGGLKIVKSIESTQVSKNVWNLTTQKFHTVNALMMSPNHWDGHGIGNRHYFFMLNGCQNDGSARGFYNEFLKPELNAHRKVIEIVGSKMRTAETQDQLSGLGFSSTQRNELLCRVAGKFTRVVKVLF